MPGVLHAQQLPQYMPMDKIKPHNCHPLVYIDTALSALTSSFAAHYLQVLTEP